MEAVSIGRDVQFGTYRSQGLSPVDFEAFHRDELPRRLRDGVNEQVAFDTALTPAQLALTAADIATYDFGTHPVPANALELRDAHGEGGALAVSRAIAARAGRSAGVAGRGAVVGVGSRATGAVSTASLGRCARDRRSRRIRT